MNKKRGRPPKYNTPPLPTAPTEFWGNKVYYLNNCLWWIKDLTEGKKLTDKKRMDETITAIEKMCNQMRQKLSSNV